MNRGILTSALFLCLFLTACGSSLSERDVLTPMPFAENQQDPSDEALAMAVSNLVEEQNAPPNSVYDFERVDLNGDGKRDGIVLFKLPHTHWCGWDGCGMAVFEARDDDFVPVATISSVRGPIYIPNTENEGWRDIIIRVSGTNLPDRNIVMKYNGRSYPQSPLLAPTLDIPLSALQTDRYFL
jgi:hypothetical protein